MVDLTNFNVLHTWNPNLKEFYKNIRKTGEFKYLNRDFNDDRFLLNNPLITRDGGLLFSTAPLIKIDQCSNLIFSNDKRRFHHSVAKDIDENIWVPTIIYPQTLSAEKVGRTLGIDGGYSDDGIMKLSPNGEVLFEKSVSQIFVDNGLEYLLFTVSNMSSFKNDPIHLNKIEPVNFDGDYWKKGDVFLSLRHQSMVLLYRPATNEIIWKGTGPFFHPHDVDILDDHRISLLNNNSKNFVSGDTVDGSNEVIIYNFKTKEYSSHLSKSLLENDVRTTTGGTSQILPNGDLFFEETNFGRSLYFNSDGSLRWSHVNQEDDGKVYRVAWSRILYTQNDILDVNNFLNQKRKCTSETND